MEEITEQELARVIEAVRQENEAAEKDVTGFTTPEFAIAHPDLDHKRVVHLRKARRWLKDLLEEGKLESVEVKRFDVHGRPKTVPGWRLVVEEE